MKKFIHGGGDIMSAGEQKLGKRLRHKEFKFIILEVQEIDGIKLWVDLKRGDTFDWVDEDLYDDLDYYLE